jgi:hypothetical protein
MMTTLVHITALLASPPLSPIPKDKACSSESVLSLCRNHMGLALVSIFKFPKSRYIWSEETTPRSCALTQNVLVHYKCGITDLDPSSS